MKMKAARFYGIKDLRLEQVEKPEANSNEIIAKIKSALTCGTDVKTYLRGTPIMKHEPTVHGHEWSGDVFEVGSGLMEFEKGTRIIATDQVNPCMKCYFCRKRQYNMCESPTIVTGAYAEYIRIPAWAVETGGVIRIPKNISYEEAAFVEPLACCIHGIDRSHIRTSDIVAIIGSGPIGLCHLQLSKLQGAKKVIMVDRVDYRLAIAEKLGADDIINAENESPVDKVKELTGNYGADIVIEAVGTPETWEQAIKMARRGGLINEFAGCAAGTEIRVKTQRLHYDELTLIGSYWSTTYDSQRALDLISSKKIKVEPIITHKMKLDEIAKAFEILTTKRDALKIALTP